MTLNEDSVENFYFNNLNCWQIIKNIINFICLFSQIHVSQIISRTFLVLFIYPTDPDFPRADHLTPQSKITIANQTGTCAPSCEARRAFSFVIREVNPFPPQFLPTTFFFFRVERRLQPGLEKQIPHINLFPVGVRDIVPGTILCWC